MEENTRKSSIQLAGSASLQPDFKKLQPYYMSEEMNVGGIFLHSSLHQTTSPIQIYSAILLAMEQDQLALQNSEEEPLTIKNWSDALSGSFLKTVGGAKKGKKVCESPKVP